MTYHVTITRLLEALKQTLSSLPSLKIQKAALKPLNKRFCYTSQEKNKQEYSFKLIVFK